MATVTTEDTLLTVEDFVKLHDWGEALELVRGKVVRSGVITGRNPDTRRAADLAFYSYRKVPRGTLSPRESYLEVAPDLVVEVRSPEDRWPAILEKVSDDLKAGVPTVILAIEATHEIRTT